MAKKHPTEQSPTDNAPAAEPSERILVIQGLTFPVSPRYAEGHTLSATEAAALNGLLGENLRNNFASQVKKAIEAAGKDAEGNPVPLSEATIDQLRAAFAKYAAEYIFSGTRASKAPVDPVEKEARKTAKTILTNALKGKNIDLKTLPEGWMDNKIDELLAANPAIRQKAKEYIDSISQIGVSVVGDLAA